MKPKKVHVVMGIRARSDIKSPGDLEGRPALATGRGSTRRCNAVFVHLSGRGKPCAYAAHSPGAQRQPGPAHTPQSSAEGCHDSALWLNNSLIVEVNHRDHRAQHCAKEEQDAAHQSKDTAKSQQPRGSRSGLHCSSLAHAQWAGGTGSARRPWFCRARATRQATIALSSVCLSGRGGFLVFH